MGLENYNLQNKIEKVINYLSQRTDRDRGYAELIDRLQVIKLKIIQEQVQGIIISHQQELINEINNLNSQSDRLGRAYSFSTAILADVIVKETLPLQDEAVSNEFVNIEDDWDVVLLILDSRHEITSKEKDLINKAIALQLPLGIIIKQDSIKPVSKIDLDLESKDREKISFFDLLAEDTSDRYESFLISFLAKIVANKKLKLKRESLNKVDRYFEQTKKQLWQEIRERKNFYLLEQNPERVQQIINQLPHRCNRIIQNYLRVLKQNNNQNKLDLVNPFCLDSLMYDIQNAIQDAEVISELKKQNVYLSLVLKKTKYTQVIHLYLTEMCQQSFSIWLMAEWHNIETQYNNGGLNKLQEQLKLELQPLISLCPDITLSQPKIKPRLQLENYICLSALENNSKIPFDYHYSQSTWFRLLVTIGIGTIVFLLIGQKFGFILLFVQIINLLVGQDAKSIRMRQHTKEMKRIIDSKYQFLIRLLADKIVQDITIALDDLNQDYQEQIENITQQAAIKLNQIKQENARTKEQITEVKQTHLKIQTMLSDR
jgi:hypothetical protein